MQLRVLVAPGHQVDFFVSSSSYNACTSVAEQSVTADEAGLASAEVQVQNNTTSYFFARSRNASGSTSNCSEFRLYTQDSAAPQPPRWAANLPKWANANMPTLSVLVEHDSRLTLFGSGDCTGAALATATAGTSNGTITFPVTVADDTTNPFSVSAADDLGNTSCSEAFTYIEDSTPPPAPVLSTTDPVSPSHYSLPFFQGTAEPQATVLLYKTEQCTGNALESGTADAFGGFKIRLTVSGKTLVRARARDSAGNLSGCSEPLAYVEDNVLPAEPTFQRFQPPPPANDNHPLLIGTSEPGSRVSIFAGHSCQGVPVASAITDAQGLFQARLSLVDDVALSFSASAADAAGNVGWCHNSNLVYIEDSTTPTVSRVELYPSARSNTNSVSVVGTATSSLPERYGNALLFASPNCQGTVVGTGSVSSGGSFTVSTTVPDDSTTVLSVVVRDLAGNTSACAGPLTFVEDSTLPSHAGALVTDGPAEDQSHQLNGASAEAHWAGFSDAGGLGAYDHFLSVSPDCARLEGTPPVTLQQPRVRLDNLALTEGTYFHCVRARDAAGNKSAWVASNGFHVDLQPPAVASTLPAQGEFEADLTAPIRFTFSEPMDPSTFTPATITVSVNGAPVAGTVACPSPTACAFTPAGPLPYREQVSVTLAASVKDLAGRALGAPATLNFTTRGRRWSAQPMPVHTARPGLAPAVAMDGQGRALALWVQGVGETFRLYAASYTPYVGWDTPQALEPLAMGEVEQPAVAMNAAGRAVALWVLRNGTSVDLYAAESAPGGGWSTPQVLESRTEAVSAPRVTVDGAGNALAVWRQSDGTAESVWAARLRVGVGWSSPLLLEAEPGAVSVPALAAVSSGAAWVAWTQSDTAGPVRVRASHFTPETGWASPQVAAEPATDAPVAVALSLDGSATIVFRRLVGAEASSLSAFASRYVPGTGWSAAATSLGPALARAEEVSVAMDRWGRALAAWTGPTSQLSQTLSLQRFTPEGGWRRVDFTAGISGQPVVEADGQGNFHVLWVESFAGNDRVMQLRYPEGSIAPGAPGPLEPEHSGTSKRPRVAANPAGGVAAVWSRDNGTGFFGNLVYANLYQ